MSESDPPRFLGGLLALLGLCLAFGGYGLMRQGDSAYYLVAGLGIAVSGVLVALGKMLGAWLYAATFAVMVAWSIAEVGADVGQLLPRILVPGVLCAYLFSGRVRPRLSR